MRDEIEKGKEMIERLGANYLYVRDIEDEARDYGYMKGLLHGVLTGGLVGILSTFIV